MCSPIYNTTVRQIQLHPSSPMIHFPTVVILFLHVNWKSKMARNSDTHAMIALCTFLCWDHPPMTLHKIPLRESFLSNFGRKRQLSVSKTQQHFDSQKCNSNTISNSISSVDIRLWDPSLFTVLKVVLFFSKIWLLINFSYNFLGSSLCTNAIAYNSSKHVWQVIYQLIRLQQWSVKSKTESRCFSKGATVWT